MPVVNGSSIAGSQLFSRTANYYASRNIENLKTVGVLQGSTADLIDRVLENRPKNGALDIKDIVNSESNAFLYPQERALLADFARLMATNPRTTTIQLQPTRPLQNDITFTVRIGTADRNASVPVAGTGFSATAERIQLGANSDNDSTTISLRDLRFAQTNAARFTPEAVADFQPLDTAIRRLLPQTLTARLQVPKPGSSDVALAAIGPVSVRRETVVRITEAVESRFLNSTAGYESFLATTEASVNREARTAVVVPPGHFLNVIGADGHEQVFGAGRHVLSSAGPATLEVWRGGVRIEEASVTVPPSSSERVDITRGLGAGAVSGSTALVAVLRNGVVEHALPDQLAAGEAVVPRVAPSSVPKGLYALADIGLNVLVTDSGRVAYRPTSSSEDWVFLSTSQTRDVTGQPMNRPALLAPSTVWQLAGQPQRLDVQLLVDGPPTLVVRVGGGAEARSVLSPDLRQL